MSAKEKLEKALELMKEAESLIKEADKQNESLNGHYGYSLEIIAQELNNFSDNSMGYIGRNTCIKDIIENEGDKWNDKYVHEQEEDQEIDEEEN
jgi:hypothetical protein